MSIAIVYWSRNGRTEEMAHILSDAIAEDGGDVEVFFTDDFSSDRVESYDALAFGCPAQGDDELEAGNFEPLWNACIPFLEDKPVVLFGSYSWGEGEWMKSWENNARESDVNVVACITANGRPDEEAKEALGDAARALMESQVE